MKCPKCMGDMVPHDITYIRRVAGERAVVRDHECSRCGYTTTVVRWEAEFKQKRSK